MQKNDLPILETVHLKKYFDTRHGKLHAVDDINIKIARGKTLGVVGESGCGKSTLGRVIIKLLQATSGQVFFDGVDILNTRNAKIKKTSKEMQMIFQDPYSSLNPRLKLKSIIAEPMKVNKITSSKRELDNRVKSLMQLVGLNDNLSNSYPHELDGGRRQRIGIARALSVNPQFIVCDEPVSALDVSIQAQILNLMMDLQDEFNLTYMFITHNLSVVKHISDYIIVMYLGQCVEQAPPKKIFSNPLHPYTKALLAAIPLPIPNVDILSQEIIRGEVSSPIEPAAGCRFAARCKYKTDKCTGENIPLIEVEDNHFVSCTLYLK